MQVPPEISIKGIEVTADIEDLMAEGISKLEQVCDYIISTRIAVEKAQSRRQTGNPYRMRIDIRLPGHREVVVKRSSLGSKKVPDEVSAQTALKGPPEPESEAPTRRRTVVGRREEPLSALITRTFDSARRELKNEVEKQRLEVKTHPEQQVMAVIEKLFREQGYGFLRSNDGQEVYFHRNSVLHNHWERLTVGTGVRFVPQMGEKGLQASTVEPVNKPGAAEMHDQLHELPSVTGKK